eukprot:TRINITY_DN1649_c0_g1_i1.p2 TRINITY_DN1649_c0_g1~~TRINITY_DN1649_c0_g1_i1.p2  ORF type:complete len:137 (-),score=31.23 TRINITY_DN1649_c0_g1_i1:172-582(-)
MAVDLVSKKAGGKVLMVSSRDDRHPGDNVIDPNENTFWISTGLYPQEILMQLGTPSQINKVKLTTTNVKSVRVEACSEETPVNFKQIAEGIFEEKAGRIQVQDLSCHGQDAPIGFVKVTIVDGYHDFCSVHRVHVE